MAAAALAGVATLAMTGCGNTYRPVVSAINPVGPASQPTKYAVAISNPGSGQPGLVTFVDFAGDTILSTPSILPTPSYFASGASASFGYVINAAGSFNYFGLGNPTSLQTKDIVQTTLPTASAPLNISVINVGNSGSTIFVPELATNKIAELNTAGPSLIQELSIGAKPVYVVGVDGAERVYAISQNTNGTGQVSAIEASTLSTSATIPVGNNPVYGVMSSDGKRTFILNKGSGTVSVINVINNAPDSTTPTIPATGTLGVNPVWAALSPLTNELIVLNAGNGTTAGTLSVVSIPLCTNGTQATNPNCNAANPVDSTGFGQVLSSVPVGINPTMAAVLADGSRAYVANQLDSTGTCAAGEGSVTVVNLINGIVETTICATSNAAATTGANTSPTLIYGHPNNVVVTSGTPTGKVYVTSWDNSFMTVIYTDTDSVVTHIPLQGLGIGLATPTAAGLPAATISQPVGLIVTAQ